MDKKRKERSDKGKGRGKYKPGGGGKRAGSGSKLMKASKKLGSKKALELIEKALLEESENNIENNS